MSDIQQTTDLIGRIYDAILTPGIWPSVLEDMTRQMGGVAASIHLHDPISSKNHMVAEFGTSPEWTALLLGRYAALSPIGAAVLLADIDQPVSAFDFIDEREFRESIYYKEWMAPQGYYDMMGALISKRPTEVGAISTVRTLDRGKFGPEAREFLGLIAPHVRRAVHLAGLLDHREVMVSNLETLIDALTTAAFVVDGAALVLKANVAGKALWGQSRGIVDWADGRLLFGDARANQLFRNALAARRTEPAMVPLKLADGEHRMAAVLPVDRAGDVFAVFVHALQPDIPSFGPHLMTAFQLTPREIAVLMPLLQGKDIAEAATGLGITVATARTHLQRLFEKTKTNRQADLVRTVMQALPPVRM